MRKIPVNIIFCSTLLAVSLIGAAGAVELRDTPYLPSLKPNIPTITGGNSGTYLPKAGSPKCFTSNCRNSGNYISGDGIAVYKNGDPLQVRPLNASARDSCTAKQQSYSLVLQPISQL